MAKSKGARQRARARRHQRYTRARRVFSQLRDRGSIKEVEKTATLPCSTPNLEPEDISSASWRAKDLWQSWFVPAAQLDKKRGTNLGTLGYLPPEIQDHIFHMTLDIHLSDIQKASDQELAQYSNSDDFLEDARRESEFLVDRIIYFRSCYSDYVRWGKTPPEPQILNLEWFLPNCHSEKYEVVLQARDASRALRDAIDSYFLSSMNIKFSCPNGLQKFFSELQPLYFSDLRQITCVVWPPCRLCVESRCTCSVHLDHLLQDWVQELRRIPPAALSALTTLNFEAAEQVWEDHHDCAEDRFSSVSYKDWVRPSRRVLARHVSKLAPNAIVDVYDEKGRATWHEYDEFMDDD